MITEQQITSIPLIDTHMHRVHPQRAPGWECLGGGFIPGPNQEIYGKDSLLFRMISHALAKRFGLPADAGIDEVEKERNLRYGKDPIGYYRDLIDSCNVAMHCVEIGSPIGGAMYSDEEREFFEASFPKEKLSTIVRIDRILEPLLKEKRRFNDTLTTYHNLLEKSIRDENAIGLKSCIAYNGGLHVRIPTNAEAAVAYERIRKGTATSEDRKCVFDFFLMESMEEAYLHDLPMQIHTGFGGGSWIDFSTMNPVKLIEFLQDSRVKNRVKIVLLHGGHPHEAYTSYLVSQFSNVYSDFSGMFYLSSLKGYEAMASLLERAPLSKIMYGSDGVTFPEVSWFAHHRFRSLLLKLLNNLIDEDILNEKEAIRYANMLSWENAINCYTALKDRVEL